MSSDEKHLSIASLLSAKGSLLGDQLYPTESRPMPTSVQRSLWAFEQSGAPAHAYFIYHRLDISGELDQERFTDAVTHLIHRNDALRCVLEEIDGELNLTISPRAGFDIKFIDISHLAPEEQEKAIDSESLSQQSAALSIANGKNLDLRVLSRHASSHVFLICLHHASADGYSIELIVKELTNIYDRIPESKAADELPINAQFSSYAKQVSEYDQSSLDYWKREMAKDISPLSLPFDFEQPSKTTFRGWTRAFSVSPSVVASIDSLCKRKGTTRAVVFQTLLQCLLSAIGNLSEFRIGTIVSTRSESWHFDVIGPLINALPIHCKVTESSDFEGLIDAVAIGWFEILRHSSVPFDLIAEFSKTTANESRLFDVLFIYQNGYQKNYTSANWNVCARQRELSFSRYPLSFEFEELDEENIECIIQYSTDVFSEASIERFSDCFNAISECCLLEPKCPIDKILAPHKTPPAVYHRYEDSASQSVPLGVSFISLVEKTATERPEAVAVRCNNTDTTYSALLRRVSEVTSHLRSLGATRATVIALSMTRDTEYLVHMLAIFQLRAIYLAVDPTLPDARRDEMLRLSGTRFLISRDSPFGQISYRELSQSRSHEVPYSTEEPAADDGVFSGYDLAYILFTSGSTGIPKAATVRQDGMLNHLYAKIFDLNLVCDDVVAQTASVTFDIHVWQFLVGLLVGAKVVIVEDDVAFNPECLLVESCRENVTVLEVVPSILAELLAQSSLDRVTLRWLISTGEALPVDLCRQWLLRFPDVPVVNAYGPTECSDDVTHHIVAGNAPPAGTIVPVGSPVVNTSIYVLGSDKQPVRRGEIGEIFVGGVGVGAGYLGDAIRTGESFYRDPFSPPKGEWMYRTGDIGIMRQNGELEYLGRADLQLKLRGQRIEAGEIETAFREYPGVLDVVVVLQRANGAEELAAFFTSQTGNHPTTDSIASFLVTRLPASMIPRHIRPVTSFPRTPSGKIDRNALPLIINVSPSTREHEDHKNTNEAQLISILQSVLDIPRISRQDDFFLLGGNSIKAVKLAHQYKAITGNTMSIRDVFRYPRVCDLALHIEKSKSSSSR